MYRSDLYLKYEITYADYHDYNTYFVKEQHKRVFETEFLDRLKFIDKMHKADHQILSDTNIQKIIKEVKKDLKYDKRYLFRAGMLTMVLFYFVVAFAKPEIGTTIYGLTWVYNNPWLLFLGAILFFLGWYYEIKMFKKNSIQQTKLRLIDEIEKLYKDLESKKQKIEARKQHNRNLNQKRKKRR